MIATAFFDVLIFGEGLASAQAALGLLKEEFTGSIGLLGAEPDPPYDRPSPSKSYLQGTTFFEQLRLRQPEHWTTKDVSLHLDTEISGLFPEPHEAKCVDGRRFHYDILIWPAGSSPRRLGVAGADLSQMHYLRGRADSEQNALDMASTAAGFIAGRAAPYCALPWFWSDQSGLKLQSAGICTGFEEEIVRGDPDSRRFTIICRRARRLITLDPVSSPADFLQGNSLIEAGLIRTSASRLADPAEKPSVFMREM